MEKKEKESFEGKAYGQEPTTESGLREVKGPEPFQSVVRQPVTVKNKESPSSLAPTALRPVESVHATSFVLTSSSSPSIPQEDFTDDEENIPADSSKTEEKAYIDESDESGASDESGESDETSESSNNDESGEISNNEDDDGSDSGDNSKETSSGDETNTGNDNEETSTDNNTDNDETDKNQSDLEDTYPSSSNSSPHPIRRIRYGSRLGRNPHLSPLMIELSRPDNTFYPSDHLSDIVVSHLMQRIANKERKILNRLSPAVKARGREYNTMINSIDIPSKIGKPPKYLIQEFQAKNRPGPNGICEGCTVEYPFKLRRTSKQKDVLILRKFVGNVETKDIELTDRRVPKEGTPMDVTAIMVTT